MKRCALCTGRASVLLPKARGALPSLPSLSFPPWSAQLEIKQVLLKAPSTAFPSFMKKQDTSTKHLQRTTKTPAKITAPRPHRRNISSSSSLSSTTQQNNMPKWEDIRDDLFEAVISVQPSLTKEQQEQIVVFMQARGHNMVWNAIRYVPSHHDRCDGG